MAGATNFPTSADSFSANSPATTGTSDTTGRAHAKRHDDVEAAVMAVESAIVTGPLNVGGKVNAATEVTGLGLRIGPNAGAPAYNYASSNGNLNQSGPFDLFWDAYNRKLHVRNVLVEDVGDPPDLVIRRGGENSTGYPDSVTKGQILDGTNTGTIYWCAMNNAGSYGGRLVQIYVRAKGDQTATNNGGDFIIGTTPSGSIGNPSDTFVIRGSGAVELKRSGLTIDTGNLVLTSGNATLTAGNLTLTSGLLTANITNTGGWVGTFANAAGSGSPNGLLVVTGQNAGTASNFEVGTGTVASYTSYFKVDNSGTVYLKGVALGSSTSFTPTLTNITIGNGTSTWSYVQIGKMVRVKGRIVLGSSTTIDGASPTFTLPVTAATVDSVRRNRGFLSIYDSGTETYYGAVAIQSTTTAWMRYFGVTGSFIKGFPIDATSPMTWTTNDEMIVDFWYEAA